MAADHDAWYRRPPMSHYQYIELQRPHPSRYGTPVITTVEVSIFRRRYFTACMQCDFCGDSCCQYGVDVDLANVERLEAHADELSRFSGVPRERWFTGEIDRDPEIPSGASTRTQRDERGCVFLSKTGRGCMIHAYCLSKGIDYHELKPMISSLFPITYDEGILYAADEVEEGSLVCVDQGPSVYRGIRSELRYYFGDALIAELDALAEIEEAVPAARLVRRDAPTAG